MDSSFSRRRNPNMENALFDWPILLQYAVKANYRWISRKFFGHEVFSPERLLKQPKATRVCIRSINQSNRSISVCLLFLFCSLVFISRSYKNRSNTYQLRLRFLSTQNLPWVPEGFCFLLAQLDPHMIALREDGNAMASL